MLSQQPFANIIPFSSNGALEPRLKLINVLSAEEKVSQGWLEEDGVGAGKAWKGYFNEASRARKREEELNSARYAAALLL